MEKHDVQLELQQNRARLRALLLPDPETGRIEADVFPRSKAMRLVLSALPLLATMATRSPLLQSLVREVALRLR